jgi:hypothetical protein
MKTMHAGKRFAALSAAAIAFALPTAASAKLTLYTENGYPGKAVWITVYDLGKLRHLDWGCVAINGKRGWASGNYAYGSFYYIRGEVKERADCGGRTLCDTTIQANPQYVSSIDRAMNHTSFSMHTQFKIHQNGNNCYWENTDTGLGSL